MPRIDKDVLDCVIYLYPTVVDAEEGAHAGGTGFLVTVSSHRTRNGPPFHLYAVSNSHVVSGDRDKGQSPVIRLNTREGDTDVLPLTYLNWIHHPDGDDLAIAPLGQIDRAKFVYRTIHTDYFVSERELGWREIGVGSEVFMVGRLMSHQGRQRNTPSVRFGNISMMPWEDVDHPSGGRQQSFLVETRSLSGYSGSPVFVYEPFPREETVEAIQESLHKLRLRRREGHRADLWNVRLLGVDWGHLREYEPVYEEVEEDGEVRLRRTEFVAKTNTGQMGVVPAWKLYEMLYSEAFVEMRKEADKELEKKKEESPFVLDVAKPDALPFDKEQFEEALRRASRKTVQSEDKEGG